MNDSYEYYLQYHKEFEGFLSELSESNDEILIALDKLVKNGKLLSVYEKQTWEKVWCFVQSDKNFNEKLDKIFKGLLTTERFESVVRPWISHNLYMFERNQEVNCSSLMRILMTTTQLYISSKPATNFFKEISTKLVDLMFHDSHCHAEIVGILHFMVENSSISDYILVTILSKSHERCDKLGLQIVCYFFKRMVEQGHDVNESETLRKYFEGSDTDTRKQGIFLIKVLIELKKFSPEDEESFKKLTIVMESLEESQHLISPTLELIKEMRFSKQYSQFWFMLCQMIIVHESSLVRYWGLDYLLNAKARFNEQQVFLILSALNSTCLYDTMEQSIDLDSLKGFIGRNFNPVLRNLTEINWMSVPFYRILELFTRLAIEMNINPQDLLKLTEVTPKRIKNLVIRSGVQELYANVLKSIVLKVGVDQITVQIIVSIYNIDPQSRCLESCLRHTREEDYEMILSDAFPVNFIDFALRNISIGKSVKQIKAAAKGLKNRDKLVMDVICYLKSVRERKKFDVFMLIQEAIKDLHNLTNHENGTKIAELIDIIDNGMNATNYKSSDTDDLVEIWRCLRDRGANDEKFKLISFKMLELILKFHQNFDVKQIEEDIFSADATHPVVLSCQYLIIKKQLTQTDCNPQMMTMFLISYERFVGECYGYKDLSFAFAMLEGLFTGEWIELWMKEPEALSLLVSVTSKLLDALINQDEKNGLIANLTKLLIKSAEVLQNSKTWIDHVTFTFETLMEKTGKVDQAMVLRLIMKSAETSNVFETESSLRTYFKQLLIEKLLETERLAKEPQIELAVSIEIETSQFEAPKNDSLRINDVQRMRLNAAQILSEKYRDEFPTIVENYMEIFSKESKKKPRYFSNTWLHRFKLHCIQPMLFCSSLTQRTVDILVDELLDINNQLNVTHLIEIILARHRPNIIEVLVDKTKILKLKAQAFKSLFSIAVLQVRIEDSFTLLTENFFGIAEVKLETLHDMIMPFTMGQNYGVRSYAQAAILILFKHVKSVFGHTRESHVLSRIAKSCEIITESMVFKNASKLVENLQHDFRFTMKFKTIWTVDTFYNHIPAATKMSFEEIIIAEKFEQTGINARVDGALVKVAEMEADAEICIVPDVFQAPMNGESKSNSLNLQQKYVPYKYQVPTNKTLSILPSLFQNEDKLLSLKPKSNLIVVGSLITRAQNLGGLSRTCEIFGAENFVLESLKYVESQDFKALSKTAEKWMKISEIKEWQLFDYLMGMRQLGYKIVGAEQSGKSVSLIGAKIPKKCVLLLGNEMKGIPADLLSLLDLTLELPQCGVVRSLNVHVTGAIVIWEYAKQHLFS